MENKKNLTKSITVVAVVFFILAVAMVGAASAKSAYLSANHHTSQFDAWNINQPGGTITYQATYSLQHASDPGGIGCDGIPKTAPVLFISSEFSTGLEMVNPITLEYMGVSSGPSNLAGVDVDDQDDIVYALKRASNKLYIYRWNPATKQLTMEPNMPITLPNLGGGYGIALDDSRDILWVSDTNNRMVRAYDVDVSGVWANIVEDTTLSSPILSLPVIDVAVDTQRNMVYTVASWAGSTLLSKYDVGAGTETTKDLGVGGIGVAVDEDTGYVYMTRGTSTSADDIQVWDTSASLPSQWTLVQDTARIGNPAGICICNIVYNPLNLSKDDVTTTNCVTPGVDSITYDICYDNLKNPDVHNAVIVDTLPPELSFVSATGPATHSAGTVTWTLGTIPAGTPKTCYQLVVNVDSGTPGNPIINPATIDSDDTPPSTVTEQTTVCDNGIPEFSTIALPVASILGLLFFFNYRKQKREQ